MTNPCHDSIPYSMLASGIVRYGSDEESYMSVAARRERERLERRQSILTAAYELFVEKGYDATTMDDIAERAELSKPTLYAHFKNQDELYLVIVAEGLLPLEQTFRKIIARKNGVEEKIKALYIALSRYYLDYQEFYRLGELFYQDNVRRKISPGLAEEINERLGRLLTMAADLIREGISTDVFRQDLNPEQFAIIIWRAIAGLVPLSTMTELTKWEKSHFKKNYFEAAIDLILSGAKR